MSLRDSSLVRPAVIALCALGAGAAFAGCGGGGYNPSDAVDKFNEQIASSGAKLECPDDVDKDKDFECTATGPGGEEKITMKISEENGKEVLDTPNAQEMQTKILAVTGKTQ